MHIAAASNCYEIFSLLFMETGNINPGDRFGGTPLHCAAIYGCYDICKTILESENIVDKNPKNHYGQTPLHWAAENGHLEICQLFLTNGVKPNPINNRGRTPSDLAKANNNMKIVNLFE